MWPLEPFFNFFFSISEAWTSDEAPARRKYKDDHGEPRSWRFIFLFDSLAAGRDKVSDALAAAVTAYPTCTGRRLRQTQMGDATVKQTWFLSGNRTQLSPQLAKRTLPFDLDPKWKTPATAHRQHSKTIWTDMCRQNALGPLRWLRTAKVPKVGAIIKTSVSKLSNRSKN